MKDWTRYYNNIFDFDRFDKLAKEGFRERLGDPDELSACIGRISIGFQMLEDRISEGVTELLQIDPKLGEIVSAELSFKSKLDLFFSLINELRSTFYFNRLEGEGFEENYLNEFRKALFKCAELRNKVIHSIFIDNAKNQKILRKKKTSKAKIGLRQTTEELEISNLLNIYDYTVSMVMEVDDFFIDFKEKKQTTHNK